MSDVQASEGRLLRLRQVMETQGWDAFCVRDTSNIAWLTAFDNVFDTERAHALLVLGERAILHTDSRYSGACEREAGNGSLVSIDAERISHAAFAVREVAAGMLALEDSISLGEFRRMEKAFAESEATFAETANVVVGLREVKDSAEIARMEYAQSITDAAFAHIIEYMKPGMTERQIQTELDGFMRAQGADELAFASIVATGPNGANPHAIPGQTCLEEGQCVVMDFGARANGYCSDMTRMVFVGKPSERLRLAYETLRAANETVERAIRPGVTGKEMHELAERVLADGGFGGKMGHGLGHGVGIDIHEEPVLAPRNTKPLVAGNVVTVEPGIYIPGEFGMRLEDFGVVTDDGFRIFTKSTHEMVIV